MDIYKSWHWLSSSSDTVSTNLLVHDLFLDGGLVDDHGLQVLPLGDFGLELLNDGGDVGSVLQS
jgi:hypothetical protein